MWTIAAPAASTAACDFGVAPRAAGLDDHGDPGVERELRAVREGEERVAREHRALRVSWPSSRAFSSAIRTASTRLIWPAPIPIVCWLSGEHDRVRRHVLADAPREEDVVPGVLGDSAADDAHRRRAPRIGVAVLHEQSAEHAPEVAFAGRVLRRSPSWRMRSACLRASASNASGA